MLCIVEGATWGWASAAFSAGRWPSLAAARRVPAALRARTPPRWSSSRCCAAALRRRQRRHAPVLRRLRRDAAALRAFLTGAVGLRAVTAGLMIAPGPAARRRRVAQHQADRPALRRPPGRDRRLPADRRGRRWWIGGSTPTPAYAGVPSRAVHRRRSASASPRPRCSAVAAGVLPAHRFATGSGILNMSRQIGLALGVAILVALIGAAPPRGLPPRPRRDDRRRAARRGCGGRVAGPWFTRRVRLPERIEGRRSGAPPLAAGGRRAPARGGRRQRRAPAPVDAVDRRRADVRRAAPGAHRGLGARLGGRRRRRARDRARRGRRRRQRAASAARAGRPGDRLLAAPGLRRAGHRHDGGAAPHDRRLLGRRHRARRDLARAEANTASGAVPARLGFTAVGEVDGDRVWRTTREAWALVSSDA